MLHWRPDWSCDTPSAKMPQRPFTSRITVDVVGRFRPVGLPVVLNYLLMLQTLSPVIIPPLSLDP